MAKHATNEEVRQAVEANVRAEGRVSAWFAAHKDDENPPASWEWADKSMSGRRDSLEDIVITFKNGTKTYAAPADLTVP